MVMNYGRNKKGQLFLLGLMLSIIYFIAVVSLIELLKTFVNNARTTLACGTAGLSVGTQMTCIVVDTYLFAFVGSGIAVALGYVFLKRLE